jgi:hypothetical protein
LLGGMYCTAFSFFIALSVNLKAKGFYWFYYEEFIFNFIN